MNQMTTQFSKITNGQTDKNVIWIVHESEINVIFITELI